MKPDALGVLGLGALGGSVAWQAARAGVERVVGYSRDRKEGVAAVRAGAVTELATTVSGVVDRVEMLVVAVPPGWTLESLRELAPAIKRVPLFCTDLTGVKGPVMELAGQLDLEDHFAGSHPLTVTEETGFSAASPDLFAGAVVYVSPLPGGNLAASEIADFWHRVMHAHPVTIDAEAHDRVVSWTSHLPHAVSSVLASVLAAHGPKGLTYGPSARSATRAAAWDPSLWAETLVANRGNVLAAIGGIDAELRWLRDALEAADVTAVQAWLERARAWRAGLDR